MTGVLDAYQSLNSSLQRSAERGKREPHTVNAKPGTRPGSTVSALLDGHLSTFELDDALTVMLDGLGGQHAALVVLQLAVEFLGELARGSDHDIKSLLRMARAGQTEEEAHGRGGEVIDVIQVEGAGLDRIGHGEQP